MSEISDRVVYVEMIKRLSIEVLELRKIIARLKSKNAKYDKNIKDYRQASDS